MPKHSMSKVARKGRPNIMAEVEAASMVADTRSRKAAVPDQRDK